MRDSDYLARHSARPPEPPTLKQSAAIALVGAAMAIAAMFAAPGVQAREPATDGDDWTVMIGAGALYAPDYEGSKDYEVLPFPFISIDYKDILYLRGPEIGANLLRVSPADDLKFSVGPVARYRRDRPEKRNAALAGLGKVDAAIELGGRARMDVGPAWVELSATKDVADGHDGMVGVAAGGVDFDLSQSLSLSLSASTSWADDKYMQSYFGVTQAQATASGLPVYAADKGIKDVGASVGVRYWLGDRWMVSATGGYTRLLNDAKDAPLVRLRGSPDQWQGGIFLAYRF
jgi:outer membrane scaffolding protein for murein synthesis (MipA/OmpV family)